MRRRRRNAGSFADGGSNTQIYGSATRGGRAAVRAVLGLNRGVGMTSYGPTDTAPDDLGSPILDSNFLAAALDPACGASPGSR